MHDGKDTVLVLRVNALVEIENTRAAVDRIVARFPGARFITLSAPNAEGIGAVRQDHRFAAIHEYPTSGPATVRGFQNFVRALKPDATVVCVDATPGLPYVRQFFSALLCPGARYVAFGRDEPRRLTALVAAGFVLRTASDAFRRLTRTQFQAKAQRLLWRVPSLPALLFQAASRAGKRGGSSTIFDKPLRRILWIRFDHFGDLMMNMPAINAITDHYHGEVEIDALVLPYSAPIIEGQPEISQVFTYNFAERDLGGQARQSLWQKVRTIWAIRRRRYDLAIEFRGDDAARQLAFLSGARYRLGPKHSRFERVRQNVSFLMTHPVEMTTDDIPTYRYNLQLLEKAGLPPYEKIYRYSVCDQSREQVRRQLATAGIQSGFAVIHASSSKLYRNWLPDEFAKVADYLTDAGYRVLLTGGPKDGPYNASIQHSAVHGDRLTDVSGMFRVQDLAAFFEQATLMVSVDTGPMHVAAAVGTPIVSIFVPWMVEWHHPYRQRASVVYPDGFPMDQKGHSGLIVLAHNDLIFPLHKLRAENVIEAIQSKLRVES